MFDAASVKLSAPDAPQSPRFAGGPGSDDPGRLQLHVNMSSLLQAAFAINVDQIKGPSWLRDFSAMPFYDLTATMPPATTKAETEQMLRNLLAERFHLAFHRETASVAGYELRVDIGGPALKEVPADSAAVSRVPGFRPNVAHQRITFEARTIPAFVAQLRFLLANVQAKIVTDGFFQPRIANKTGLTGRYTFTLEFNCKACVPLDAIDDPAAGDSGGAPDLFVALQKQLGLKLTKTAEVPIDLVVVDALEKTPTAN
jgi:uncharacterized protein (TIGR03435 family)